MALFWIVHDVEGARGVRIEKSHALIFARLNAMIDGFGARSSRRMRSTRRPRSAFRNG
jgi:hypothetical protein